MRNSHFLTILGTLLLLSIARGEGPATMSSAITYKPPKRGAPSARVGGGSRAGTTLKLPTLWVLLPPEVASTTRAQPTLYWFLSEPTQVRFEISLVDMSNFNTIYRDKSDGVEKAGIHKLDLSKANISLKPNALYRWRIALVPDPGQKSKDLDSSGTITFIATPDGLANQLSAAGDHLQKAKLYADSSIWCEALDELGMAIDANPGDASLHAMRAELLKQANLPEPAEYESAAH